MIKNNFKILEEEREKILSSVRLSNYRKPFLLKEQDDPEVLPDDETPAPKTYAAKLTPSWNKSQEDTNKKNQTQRGQFKEWLNQAFVNNIGDEVNLEGLADLVISKIQQGMRGQVFKVARQILSTYNSNRLSELDGVVTKAEKDFSDNLGVIHKVYSQPTEEEMTNIYQKVGICDKVYPCYFKNWDVYKPAGVDVTKSAKILDCNACMTAAKNYLNNLITNVSMNQLTLDKFKSELTACWYSIKDPQKNLFGRYKFTSSCSNTSDFKGIFDSANAGALVDNRDVDKLNRKKVGSVTIGRRNERQRTLTPEEFEKYKISTTKLNPAPTT